MKKLLTWLKEARYNLADKDDLRELKWGTIGNVNGMLLHDGDNLAQLMLLARILDNRFNLTPHGGWRPDNTFSKDLSKQKVTAIFVKTGKVPFNAYYDEAKRNIKELQEQAAHPGTNIVSVVRDDGIRISWPLFEQVEQLAGPVNIRNKLALIKTSHVPLQLLAYNINGTLISPTYWREELQGAVMKLKLVM
ncbi:hypothetical protein CALCODRAFT_512836 [Calocera cornea HHB12733]|uniref:Uncharacterized protein n=1 Tax=Calocera cornea HHB12733 TaxID=1353952 RepID=A0A165CQX4_9BASI|nr:hypothetical protein CALCODRAFT_512836 [Calocera cornea HHB12733]